ncbi:MAG: TolC family protein [Bacteroidales bacterium]|nr:TolC family protein [Bacteroidales bacterium]
MSAEAHPLRGKGELIKQKNDLAVQNIQTAWYPSFNINAKASWQSEVTSIKVDNPMIDINIPSPSHDQYNVTLDIAQLVWDGRGVNKEKLLQQSQNMTELASLEKDLYQINFSVSKAYFSILLLQEKLKIIDNVMGVIDKRITVAENSVQNGVLLRYELDALKAEKVKMNRQRTEITTQIESAFETLTMLTGRQIKTSTALSLPSWSMPNVTSLRRPEIDMFTLGAEHYATAASLLNAKRQPKLAAFTQAGYGKPGLDFLSDEFNEWLIVGVKLQWNIYDWNKVKREKQQLGIQQDMTQLNRQSFERLIQIELQQAYRNLQLYKELVEQDEQLVALRHSITKAVEAKLENGVATVTEYLTELSNETQARLEQKSHQILMHQSIVNYNLIAGNINQ